MSEEITNNVSAINAGRGYDLLLTGGRVIDPAPGLDGLFDVGIVGARIVDIGASLPAARAKVVRDVSGRLVLPGLIDTHAHCYTHVCGDFGLEPEDIGVKAGVTTVVDQGGASPLTIGGFDQFISKPSKTRVLSFVSTYLAGGLQGHRYVNLYSPDCIDVPAIVKAAEKYPDLIRGIKSHAEEGNYSRWGVGVLRKSKEAGRETGLPVYIHLGTLWPSKDGLPVDAKQLLDDVLPLMDKNDVLAHPFSRHPSGFVGKDGRIHPLINEAVARGVKIDVGRGSHFSFNIARQVVEAGFIPDTLGADLHAYNTCKVVAFNTQGQFSDADVGDANAAEPTFSLHHSMTELLSIGVPLHKVIATVTSNAAEMLRLSDSLGSLQVGREADISVVELERGSFTLQDGMGATQSATERFKPDFVVRAGALYEPDSYLLPRWERRAA
ncbi:amidohydrolase/deacetylase family metallohydrolase [soil metagenome]